MQSYSIKRQHNGLLSFKKGHFSVKRRIFELGVRNFELQQTRQNIGGYGVEANLGDYGVSP